MTIDIENVQTWPWGVYTCHTADCINRGVGVQLQVPEDPLVHFVTCGGCHVPIDDKRAQ